MLRQKYLFSKKTRAQNYDKTLFHNEVYSEVKVLGYSFLTLLFDLIKARRTLKLLLQTRRPKSMILSGVLVWFFIDIIKTYKKYAKECKVFYDAHGVLEELIEYSPSNIKGKFTSYILFLIFRSFEKEILRISEGILVVSKNLERYFLETYKDIVRAKAFFIIPCSVTEVRNGSMKNLERKHWRDVFGVNDEVLLFVYSGGVSRWQMVEEIIDLFEEKLHPFFKNSKMCFFTQQTNLINYILSKKGYNCSNYIIKSFKGEEVKGPLAACDCGIILRNSNLTNEVAFPNKVSEYIEAGLCVIISSALREPAELIEKYRLGVIVNDNRSLNIYLLNNMLLTRNQDLSLFYERCNRLLFKELSYKITLDRIFQSMPE